MLCSPPFPSCAVNPPCFARRWTGYTMEITPAVAKTFIKTVQKNGCGVAEVSLYNSKSYINIFRKGDELVILAQYNAFELDCENNLGFYWDEAFLSQPPGFYGGDVYINGAYCFSVEFRIPRCAVEVSGSYNVEELVCETECGDLCPPLPDGLPGAMPTFLPCPPSPSPDQGCPVEQIAGDCDGGASCDAFPCTGGCG